MTGALRIWNSENDINSMFPNEHWHHCGFLFHLVSWLRQKFMVWLFSDNSCHSSNNYNFSVAAVSFLCFWASALRKCLQLWRMTRKYGAEVIKQATSLQTNWEKKRKRKVWNNRTKQKLNIRRLQEATGRISGPAFTFFIIAVIKTVSCGPLSLRWV